MAEATLSANSVPENPGPISDQPRALKLKDLTDQAIRLARRIRSLAQVLDRDLELLEVVADSPERRDAASRAYELRAVIEETAQRAVDIAEETELLVYPMVDWTAEAARHEA